MSTVSRKKVASHVPRLEGAVHAVRGIFWYPLACGRVPYPPYARCGMGRLCGERRRRERFERLKGAKGSACPVGTWPKAQSDPKRGSETMSATVREARMIEQPGARNAACSTRHRPPPGLPPAPAPEVWRAAALQVKSYRPAPPGGRGVCAPRRKHSLHVSPAAPKAQGKRAPPGGKDRQRRAFPTPAVRPSFSDELIAVCRSSPRCPR